MNLELSTNLFAFPPSPFPMCYHKLKVFLDLSSYLLLLYDTKRICSINLGMLIIYQFLLDKLLENWNPISPCSSNYRNIAIVSMKESLYIKCYHLIFYYFFRKYHLYISSPKVFLPQSKHIKWRRELGLL